MSFAATDFLLF